MSNTCQCDQPPGGSMTCSDDQLAVCVVQNGVAHGSCYEQPSNATSLVNQQNWVLGIVLNTPRLSNQSITGPELQILASQRVQYPDGTVVTFRIPGANLFPGGGLPSGGGGGDRPFGPAGGVAAQPSSFQTPRYRYQNE